MLIATSTVIALRCSACGKLEEHALSYFDFAGKKTNQVKCSSCETLKLNIGTKDRKRFWLQIPCVLCDAKHMYYFKKHELWNEGAIQIFCSESRVDIGFVGAAKEVSKMVASYEQDLIDLLEEMDQDDFFHNPHIMMEILNQVHDIAEEGYLLCGCGNRQIDVDILPDRLELTCPSCGAVGIIYAETDEDIEFVRQIEVLELVKGGFTYLDGFNNNRKSRNRRKGSKQ